METQTKSEYDIQAEDFLERTGTTLELEFLRVGKYFNDNLQRNIWKFTLKCGNAVYSAEFGDSISDSFPYVFSKNCPQSYKSLWLKAWSEGKPVNTSHWTFAQHALAKKLKQPSAYDILSCLTKYDPGTFEDFCSEFGYDTDSRTAEKTYHEVVQEYLGICRLWNKNERELLAEIQ